MKFPDREKYYSARWYDLKLFRLYHGLFYFVYGWLLIAQAIVALLYLFARWFFKWMSKKFEDKEKKERKEIEGRIDK